MDTNLCIHASSDSCAENIEQEDSTSSKEANHVLTQWKDRCSCYNKRLIRPLAWLNRMARVLAASATAG